MQIHKNDLISYAPYESGSTIIDSAIVNGLVVEVIKIMIKNNFTPPIFKSGNADDFTEYNSKLINKYKDRIPLLEEEEEIGIFSTGD